MMMAIDWYERRNDLEPGQVFSSIYGSPVKLDRTVPGDGSAWYVADWDDHHRDWAYYDARIEPNDLIERLPDDYAGAEIA